MPPILPPRGGGPPLPRVVTYYQTHHTRAGRPISILPILSQPEINMSHVILAAFHINDDPQNITLNDHHPSHERFTTLWSELATIQASGVKVMAMMGGAARGTFTKLDRDEATFERYWGPLRDVLQHHRLDGLDLDVEEPMSLGGIVRLIDRVRADFGPDFIITLAPVALALLDSQRNLSGFDYEALEVMRGPEIAWYNTQFYNGWGDAGSPILYEMMVRKGWPARKIVYGVLTSPENGNGWVPIEVLGPVLAALRARHPDFGGVMGWEYFNCVPAKERPWEWARWMSRMFRPVLPQGLPGPGPGPGLVPVPVAKVRSAPAVVEADPDVDGSAAAAAGGRDAPVPVPRGFEYYSDGEEGDGTGAG